MKRYRVNRKTFLSKQTAGEFILRPDARNRFGVAQPDHEDVVNERKWSIDKKL